MYPGTHAAATPNKPAVILAETGKSLTYAELDDASRRFAVALRALGVDTGDVVAMLSDNAVECFIAYWGALRSGLYLTAINFHLTAAEASYIVSDSDAVVLISSADVGELAASVRELNPQVAHAYSFGGRVEGHSSFEDLLSSAGEATLDRQPRGSDMLYSSGTTGRPKGIKPPLPQFDVDQPGDPLTGMAGHLFGFTDADVYLSPAPIYHAAPLRWCGVVHAYGGTVVLMNRFTAQAALAAIDRHRVTITQMVPTMFVRMLQLDPDTRAAHDVSSLRLAIHAAAPCPPEVKQAMIDWWGQILVEYYSSTESNGITVITTPEWLNKPGSVGRSMLGPVHIIDDDGNEVPSGTTGLVYFEREQLPFTYHKSPERTAAAQHRVHPNWTTVGDIGFVDDDGYLFLTDRQSFMIISGGVNIYPREVEDALTLHPAVFDVAVIGVPDPVLGQEVKAVVQVRDGVAETDELAQELIDYTLTKVAKFKAPKSVDFVAALPRTPTGKLVKRLLADNHATSESAAGRESVI